MKDEVPTPTPPPHMARCPAAVTLPGHKPDDAVAAAAAAAAASATEAAAVPAAGSASAAAAVPGRARRWRRRCSYYHFLSLSILCLSMDDETMAPLVGYALSKYLIDSLRKFCAVG